MSETVTVRLSGETKQKLAELAGHTRRTKSFLAGEAIADYVDRELAIVAGIQRGLDDAEAGRVTPHAEAMRRLRSTIERAKKA
ncbi:MAG: CopG family ribbon-helix-helix protein [Rhizobiaceae bacterium]